jgi:hypothetical protein
MKLYIFHSCTQANLFGFTIDPLGNNLPAADSPWESAGNAIPLGVTMASTSPQIAEEVERLGFASVEGREDIETQPRVERTKPRP